MPSALVGVASCGVCATLLGGGAAACPTCGARVLEAVPGSAIAGTSGALTGTSRPAGWRMRIAVALDVAVVVAAAGCGAAIALLPHLTIAVEIGTGALLGAAVAVAALAAALHATGRSPGRLALRLRTVDNLSGLPPRGAVQLAASLAGARSRSLLTADLAAGRDPLARTLRTASVVAADLDDGRPASPPAPPAAAPVAAAEGMVARLRFDSGEELVVAGAVLVGRQPESTPQVKAVHALPDLSRTLARTHARLDWSDGLLWVTDLGAPSGTEVITRDGTREPLVPGVRAAAAIGWRVRMGRVSFEVGTTQATRPPQRGRS